MQMIGHFLAKQNLYFVPPCPKNVPALGIDARLLDDVTQNYLDKHKQVKNDRRLLIMVHCIYIKLHNLLTKSIING